MGEAFIFKSTFTISRMSTDNISTLDRFTSLQSGYCLGSSLMDELKWKAAESVRNHHLGGHRQSNHQSDNALLNEEHWKLHDSKRYHHRYSKKSTKLQK